MALINGKRLGSGHAAFVLKGLVEIESTAHHVNTGSTNAVQVSWGDSKKTGATYVQPVVIPAYVHRQ